MPGLLLLQTLPRPVRVQSWPEVLQAMALRGEAPHMACTACAWTAAMLEQCTTRLLRPGRLLLRGAALSCWRWAVPVGRLQHCWHTSGELGTEPDM